MNVVEVKSGDGPVVLGFPHTGTTVPGDIAERLNEQGKLLTDTDWHVDRLYDGLLDNVTTVRARFHRYVIDANRDPSGKSLYPGQNTTDLVPLTDFDNRAIWKEGREPTAGDVVERLRLFHAPYHAALWAELERVREKHGVVLLYDCHSIRSRAPFLFDGRLPDFNIGDNDGTTCDPAFTRATAEICEAAEGYSHVVNGRFKGGWTTRHYGKPSEGIHTIQMELTQATHLKSETVPFDYGEESANRLRVHLGAILKKLEAIALSLAAETRP